MSYKSTSTKGYIPYDFIEPNLVREHKEVDRYIKLLNITLPQEEFILKCLLSQKWGNKIIIGEIKEISREKTLGMTKYKFSLVAPSMNVSYCDSNPFEKEGWSLDNFEDRASSVYHTFIKRLIKY